MGCRAATRTSNLGTGHCGAESFFDPRARDNCGWLHVHLINVNPSSAGYEGSELPPQHCRITEGTNFSNEALQSPYGNEGTATVCWRFKNL